MNLERHTLTVALFAGQIKTCAQSNILKALQKLCKSCFPETQRLPKVTPQDRAEKSAAAMWATDTASQALGMRIDRVAPGEATLSMAVTANMLNGHGICHGGFIFTLADSAFAFACNSYNQSVVAQQNQITYIAPGAANERLTAAAKEQSKTGRSGIYDVTVTGEDGRVVALFRGLSRTVKGQHFEEETSP